MGKVEGTGPTSGSYLTAALRPARPASPRGGGGRAGGRGRGAPGRMRARGPALRVEAKPGQQASEQASNPAIHPCAGR